jgi:hypothetical protein
MVFPMDTSQPTEFELDDDLQSTGEALKPPSLDDLSPEEHQLHTEIKARATIPTGFKKLSRANPPRPFELHLPTGFVERFSLQPPPIAFFKLFFSRAIIESICTNTNTYATSKESQISRYGPGRRWKPVSSQEIYIFFALLIYIGTYGGYYNVERF